MAFERFTYVTRFDTFGTYTEYADLGADLKSDLKSAQAFIPLDITAVREIKAGSQVSDATRILERVNGSTDKALRLTWAAGDSAEFQFPPTPWPPDLNAAADVIVHLMMARGGTTDDCDIDVLAYENGAGAYAADTEMGGKTAALTAAANLVVEATVTLTASNIGGHPGFLNLALLPDAHTTDAIYLYTAWLEYTRALRTS
ncbi:MAG TPA: hypothetical protein VMW52_03030 [Phycisphaerae bacterium]|nr:hypothetical protein [Phycisphaerae bacterium]